MIIGLILLTLALVLFCAITGEGGLALGILFAVFAWLIGGAFYFILGVMT